MGSFEGDPQASEESLTDIGIAPKSHKRSKSSPRGGRPSQEAITTRLQSRTQVSYDGACLCLPPTNQKKLLFHPTLLLLSKSLKLFYFTPLWGRQPRPSVCAVLVVLATAPIRSLSPFDVFLLETFSFSALGIFSSPMGTFWRVFSKNAIAVESSNLDLQHKLPSAVHSRLNHLFLWQLKSHHDKIKTF